MRKQTEFPKFKPPFQEITADGDGNIWVQPYGAGEEAYAGFDAFDPAGKFLGHVGIVDGGAFPRTAVWIKGRFWTIRPSGDEGEYAIVKYRIEAAK